MNEGFFTKVYEIVRQIPLGKVATYGQIARLTGNPRMSRQVGWALHVNPEPYTSNLELECGKSDTGIPCHRVVNREGRLSGGFAFGGIDVQRYLLLNEGVEFVDDETVDLTKFLWEA